MCVCVCQFFCTQKSKRVFEPLDLRLHRGLRFFQLETVVLPWRRLLNDGSINLSLSLSSHLGSFHNTHNTQNFRFERASSWRQIGSQFMRTGARQYRCQTERPKGRKEKKLKKQKTHALWHTHGACVSAKRAGANIVNAKMMLVHSWRGERRRSPLLSAFYSFCFCLRLTVCAGG